MASDIISADELAVLIDNKEPLALLDVRGASYLMGHLPGAVSCRWQDFLDTKSNVKGMLHPDRDVVASRFGELGVSSGKPVVIYSDPLENWGAEGRFFWMLHYLGHDDVRVLDGGYPRWKKENRHTAVFPVMAREQSFSASLRDEAFIDLEGVRACMNAGPDTVIVDAREADELKKEGNIPGAVNLPWKVVYDTDGGYLPGEEIRKALEGAGLTPDKRIVPYCTGGVRSAVLWMWMHLLGYEHISNYDGSWWEWEAAGGEVERQGS